MIEASVIVPTFNRLDALLETLEALAKIDYAADQWEAVVIDDGSEVDTEGLVKDVVARTGAPLRFLSQSNAGPAAARNRGAREARGGVLIFIDNDIIVAPSFIRQHLAGLNQNPGCWIIGRVVHSPQIRSTPFGRYRDSVWESFNESQGSDRVAETDGITAANLSLPARDFERFGGFDESFTIASSEDWELGIRARRAGIRVLYDPQLVVTHNDWAISLDRFCERQRLYSISDVLLWRKYGNSSPRARLVHESAPVDWKGDGLGLTAKKVLKTALATDMGRKLVRLACQVSERLTPDHSLNRRCYDLAVGTAIFEGVREGLKRY